MEQKTVQSVDRALSIIECLWQGEKELQNIANDVKLNKSTVHRMLRTLMLRGYVLQDSITGAYRLGPKFIAIGKQMVEEIDIVRVAKPYLKDLNDLTGEVIHLVMLDGDHGIYIDKLVAKHNVSMYSYIGKRVSIYSSAVGKAYLAFSNYHDVRLLINNTAKKSVALTPKTITSKKGMLHAIESTKEKGYAIDNEENEEGVICVAAPIFNHLGKVEYAVSISTPTYRLTEEKMEEYGRFVKECGKRISNELGYYEYD